MAAVIGKILLCSIPDFNNTFTAIQGVNGQTLFDKYNSLKNIVDKNIDSQFQDFISLPNISDSKIEFYGPKNNDPLQTLAQLEGDALNNYNEIKDQTVAHYQFILEKLKTGGKADEARFIEGAIKFIDDKFIYCYDNKVVLAVWGMTMRTNVKEDLTEIVFGIPRKINNPTPPPETPDDDNEEIVPLQHRVSFTVGDKGSTNQAEAFYRDHNHTIQNSEIPAVTPKDGYKFLRWDSDPLNHNVDSDVEFKAVYEQIPPPIVPWYKRWWRLFTEKGCLKWLLWLLLLLILLLLCMWLLKGCHERRGSTNHNRNGVEEVPTPDHGVGNGIYNPNDPYISNPRPPGYDHILPPQEGVLPPEVSQPDIIPGNPTIIANRLNILMENEDKSILDFAKAFKEKYPDEKYKIVYYDNIVKRLQVEVPRNEREKLKNNIPGLFAPEFEVFVFDEALFEANDLPNDPAVNNAKTNNYLHKVRAQQAWDITKGVDSIVVAIVDNGFNTNHIELKNKVVKPYNVWTHSNQVYAQKVDHGTHVAGIALATANNNEGISGIAPNCKFMPVQVANQQGYMTTTSVLDGILYAVYQGAHVVNVSLGTQFASISNESEQVQKQIIATRFKEEERLWRQVMRITAKRNATIVMAAGNDNVLTGLDPLQRPELFITVGAIDSSGNLHKANFSNYGQHTTISAPGVDIYSTVGNSQYLAMDGTSMASPIVAGAVALIKSINPKITTRQIICILKETGATVNGNVGKLIQIDRALQMVKNNTQVDCTPKPTSGDVQVLLSWNNYNDLDLLCTDPNGESVFFKNRNVSSGGVFEIDMNVEYPDSKKPIENIYWPNGKAPNGTYNVYVSYYKQHGTTNETPYSVKLKYGATIKNLSGVIKQEDKVVHIGSFTLGASDTPAQRGTQQQNKLEQKRDQLQTELNRINEELKRISNRQ